MPAGRVIGAVGGRVGGMTAGPGIVVTLVRIPVSYLASRHLPFSGLKPSLQIKQLSLVSRT